MSIERRVLARALSAMPPTKRNKQFCCLFTQETIEPMPDPAIAPSINSMSQLRSLHLALKHFGMT